MIIWDEQLNAYPAQLFEGFCFHHLVVFSCLLPGWMLPRDSKTRRLIRLQAVQLSSAHKQHSIPRQREPILHVSCGHLVMNETGGLSIQEINRIMDLEQFEFAEEWEWQDLNYINAIPPLIPYPSYCVSRRCGWCRFMIQPGEVITASKH